MLPLKRRRLWNRRLAKFIWLCGRRQNGNLAPRGRSWLLANSWAFCVRKFGVKR